MTPKSVEILIIGSGPTGLGAGFRLAEIDRRDFLIVDEANEVGGLSRSFRDEKGFTWDIGGHVQFSHYPYFDKVMDAAIPPDGWLNHERESWVWLKERFIPYPLQNNIRLLPPEDLERCLAGFWEMAKRKPTTPKHFGEWLKLSFGDALNELFMEPYNRKVWAFPPSEMNYQWIGERVATIDVRRILANIAHQRNDVSWGPNNRFRFPRRGGTGAIWQRVADLVGRHQILLNCGVTAIDPRKRTALLTTGETVQFQTCVSTVPLDRLARLVKGLPKSIVSLTGRLKHSSTHVVGIGIQGQTPPHLKGKCWMYFPEANCPFYRVTVFSHYAPSNVPEPGKQWSLMTEVSESSKKKINANGVLDDVIQGLIQTKLIQKESDIVSRWAIRAEYGYPTPSLERDSILARVQPPLEKLGIFSRGRFGGWKYEVSNQDHSFMQGVEVVDRIIRRKAETTYTWRFNAKKNRRAA